MFDYRKELGFDKVYDEYHKYLSKLIDKLNIIDIHMIACGGGYPLYLLSLEKKYNLSGSDISVEAISTSKMRYSNITIDFFLCDMRRLNLNSKQDLIFSLDGCINHIFSLEEVEETFYSVFRNLKDKGYFYVEFWTEKEVSEELGKKHINKFKIGEYDVYQEERRLGNNIHNMMTEIKKDGEIIEIFNAYHTSFNYQKFKELFYKVGFKKVVELSNSNSISKKILAFKY